MNLKILLTNLIMTLFLHITFPQENIRPINISPFIGDTLDRVERDYFGLLPGIQNFQEAFWFYNNDSLLMVNVKVKDKVELIDTTFPSVNSLSDLRNRINGVLYKSIKDEKVKKQEITTSDSVYIGTIYSYQNNKLTLIQNCCSDNIATIGNDLISKINTYEIQTIKTKETNFLTTLLATSIGLIGFGALGSSLAPEKSVQETKYRTIYDPFGNPYTEEYLDTGVAKDNKYSILFGIGGAILGYFIGQAIKYTVEYDMRDPKADEVIRENTLLPSGINFTN